MKLGWVADYGPGRLGGADLSRRGIMAEVPGGVEVVLCTPGDFDAGCDGYIVVSLLFASRTQLELLGRLPHVVTPRDLWLFPPESYWRREYAAAILKSSALMVFMSPLHAARFKELNMGGMNVREGDCISAFDPDPFLAVRGQGERQGNLWIGDFQNTMRGLRAAIEWCMERGETLDVLGYGGETPAFVRSGRYSEAVRLLPTVPHAEMPAIYAGHARLVSLPSGIDPCGRAVMEATLAGLEVEATAETTGVMSYDWWPDVVAVPELLAARLRKSPSRFWGLVIPAIVRALKGKG